ncbi:hypothetical protein ACFJGV_17605 [Cnuibacter sp. UC19_7]|uniref:hypothetical protein n=1 Tax=Cnuibacter sp. UC19_7 TaxID=3350166 RepID=UPI00366B0629
MTSPEALSQPAPGSPEAEILAARLQARSAADPSYWDFASGSTRNGTHALFQYPAMMVPALQGALLDDVFQVLPPSALVYDPFGGSGTVLTEALRRGHNFVGSDINPMALLLMSLKAEPPTAAAAKEQFGVVLSASGIGLRGGLPLIPNLSKWFEPEVQEALRRLRLAIRQLESRRVRRFYWVCLAETVRLTSNSRISTFKLHAYTAEETEARSLDAVRTFRAVVSANIEALRAEEAEREGTPNGNVLLLPGPAETAWSEDLRPQVLMTSPPYGDNKTTVPYGQHSYLPLAWIDGHDIPGGISREVMSSTSAIDSRSLGGSLVGADSAMRDLTLISPATAAFAQSMPQASLRKKVLAFSRDYVATIQSIIGRLAPSGYSFFTLGERRVGGRGFPLVELTNDILAAADHVGVAQITRALPRRRRIGPRNSEGTTMAQEFIIVTQAPR